MAAILTHESEQVLLDHALSEITERVERWPDRRVFLIVPESSKADVERRYLERDASGGLLMAEVLSFKRLAFRLFAEAGGLGVKRLSATGRAVLIGRLLLTGKARFNRFDRLRQKPGFAFQLSALWEEFSRFMVDEKALLDAAASEKEPRARARFEDLATLWTMVEDARRNEGFVDAATDSQRLIELLQNEQNRHLDFLSHTSVYVAGFGELTPFSATEISILSALNARVAQLTVLLPAGQGASYLHAARSLERLAGQLAAEIRPLRTASPMPPQHKYLVYASSVEDEARFVAGEIRRLLTETDLKRRDIAVGLADPESSRILADTLRAFDVPAFIDEASSVKWTPFARLMDAVLKISQRQDDLDQVMRLLSNPLSGIERALTDRVENFCLSRGIKRLSGLLDTTRLPDDERDQAAIAACLPLLRAVDALGAALREARSGAAKVMLLQEFLRGQPDLFDRIEADIARDFADDYTLQATAMARSVNEWQEKLAEAAEILGDERISQAHFCSLLSESIFQLEVKQIPVGIDRVRVAPLRQIVHYPSRVLFVTGVVAGTYPLKDTGTTFLTVEERKHLADLVSGFPNGSDDHRLSGAAIDRKVRTLPSLSLYFICPEGKDAPLPAGLEEKGWQTFVLEEQVPGMHWNHPEEIRRRLPRLTAEARQSAAVKLWLQAFRAAGHEVTDEAMTAHFTAAETAILDPEILEKALARRFVASVSLLQLFNRCPYQFYASALLGLEERDIGVPDAAVQGSFLHNVLHASVEMLLNILETTPEEKRAKAIDDWLDALERGGQQAIEAKMMVEGRARSLAFPGNDVRVVSRLSPAIRENLERIRTLYVEDGARPVALEYRFTKDSPEAVSVNVGDHEYRFSGVIDRIDRYPDGSDVLIDYKRGTHAFRPADFEAGVDIQLPFYQNAWQKLDPAHRVSGFYYQTLQPYERDSGFAPPVSDPDAHLKHVAKEMQRDEAMAERAIEIAAETLQAIESGEVSAMPYVPRNNSEPCRFCAYRVACRLDPLTGRIARAMEQGKP